MHAGYEIVQFIMHANKSTMHGLRVEKTNLESYRVLTDRIVCSLFVCLSVCLCVCSPICPSVCRSVIDAVYAVYVRCTCSGSTNRRHAVRLRTKLVQYIGLLLLYDVAVLTNHVWYYCTMLATRANNCTDFHRAASHTCVQFQCVDDGQASN